MLRVPSSNRTDQNWKLPLPSSKYSPLSQLGFALDWKLAVGNGFASVSPPYVAPSGSPGTLAPQVSLHRVVRVREADHEDREPLTDRRRPEPDPHPERGSHPPQSPPV